MHVEYGFASLIFHVGQTFTDFLMVNQQNTTAQQQNSYIYSYRTAGEITHSAHKRQALPLNKATHLHEAPVKKIIVKRAPSRILSRAFHILLSKS
jgi:hypothetical protein